MSKNAGTELPLEVVEVSAYHLNSSHQPVHVSRLTGDASNRSYFRISRPLVVALYSEPFGENESALDRLRKLESYNPSARLTFANDPCAHVEVTNLFLEEGLPVPQLLGVLGAAGAILLEDVGDTRLQDWLKNHSASEAVEAYRTAIDLIVRIQNATERAVAANSICSHLAFDEAKLRWELGFFFANYFNRYLQLRLDPQATNAVQADFKGLCSELSARARVLTHRDYHARNLMMHRGEMFMIDHQDARMGPASYDLASLLRDPYTTLPQEATSQLIEWFIEMKMRSKLPLVDVGEFQTELELMTVQRMLKAIGTYASQAAVGNPVYIPYIEPALERALAAMKSLGRFDATRSLLERTRS